jgi:hypothetical protein
MIMKSMGPHASQPLVVVPRRYNTEFSGEAPSLAPASGSSLDSVDTREFYAHRCSYSTGER